MTRAVWKLVHRINRTFARADAARGECMNMQWLHWFGLWTEAWEALQRIAIGEGAGVLCHCGEVVVTVSCGGAQYEGRCHACGCPVEV